MNKMTLENWDKNKLQSTEWAKNWDEKRWDEKMTEIGDVVENSDIMKSTSMDQLKWYIDLIEKNIEDYNKWISSENKNKVDLNKEYPNRPLSKEDQEEYDFRNEDINIRLSRFEKRKGINEGYRDNIQKEIDNRLSLIQQTQDNVGQIKAKEAEYDSNKQQEINTLEQEFMN